MVLTRSGHTYNITIGAPAVEVRTYAQTFWVDLLHKSKLIIVSSKDCEIFEKNEILCYIIQLS